MQERGTRSPLSDLTTPEPDGRWRRRGLLGLTAAVVVALDQLTKWWVVAHLADHDLHVVWTLRLVLARNSGAAFSTATGLGGFIGIIAVVVVGVLVWIGQGVADRRAAIGLGFVLGGALGNLADRAFRSGDGPLGGSVIDWIDFHWWPVFNVADAALTVGAIASVFVLGATSSVRADA